MFIFYMILILRLIRAEASHEIFHVALEKIFVHISNEIFTSNLYSLLYSFHPQLTLLHGITIFQQKIKQKTLSAIFLAKYIKKSCVQFPVISFLSLSL